jgi:hypothetical protein
LIGLSPLSSGHPLRFQPKWVRASTGSYPRFTLPKDSSPGFASARCDSLARLKTRFRCGSLPSLTSPHRATRWLILQKARRHSHLRTAPTAWGRTVSGAVSLPSRGAFHLSLTVLVRYRSRESVQPWRVVPPASNRVSRARPYSGIGFRRGRRFRVRGSHPLWPAFPCRSATVALCDRRRGSGTTDDPPRNADAATPQSFNARVGLGWCAFARRYSRNLG